MPVRCGTGYARPWRVRWFDRNGRPRARAFHWEGPARDWLEWLKRNRYRADLIRVEGKGDRTPDIQLEEG